MHTAIIIDDVFTALGDPTRRQLLEQLGETGQASASALAANMPISRQAIAKHMRLLEDAGLVVRHRRGKQIEFAVDTDHLAATGRWMQRIAERWQLSDARVAAKASA
jgi:DNA-binding transcriptional ArsR family regulator